ncbi:MAG: glycosyltransferase family 2 protein [Planctomycetes bacterium]|nr:glycosyltransferase family 2 protein [Planctomycetota bacterium]
MATVTAFIMTLNEEEMLPRCLKRLTWADEILVVDSHSTDKTVDIAQSFGARIIARDFAGFGPTTNFGQDEAKSDWIFHVDADELVTTRLQKAVQDTVAANPPEDIFSVHLDSVVFGRRLKSSSWSGEYPRLWRRGALRFEGAVHPQRIISGKMGGRLDGVMLHYPYRSVAKYFEKSESYSNLWALKAKDKGRRSGLAKATVSGAWRVFHDYFIRGGIRDGRVGLLLAMAGGMHTFTRHIKLWGMEHAAELSRVDEEMDA